MLCQIVAIGPLLLDDLLATFGKIVRGKTLLDMRVDDVDGERETAAAATARSQATIDETRRNDAQRSISVRSSSTAPWMSSTVRNSSCRLPPAKRCCSESR